MVQALVCIVLKHNSYHVLYYITRYHEYMWYWVWIIQSHYFRICMLCISSGFCLCATCYHWASLCIHYYAGQSSCALTRHTAGWANRTSCFIGCVWRRIYYQKLVVLQNDQNQLTNMKIVVCFQIQHHTQQQLYLFHHYNIFIQSPSHFIYVCDDFIKILSYCINILYGHV